jgi:hypothetical protein
MLPDKFAMLVVALCRLFKNRDGEGAKLCWEMQGPGATFGITVIEAGYNTVYLRTNELNPLEKFKLSEKPGWVPRADNKNVLLQDYRTALYDEILINRSEAAIKECAQFIEDAAGNIIHGNVSQKRGRRNDSSTAAVNHGDMVMADALAWMMAKPLHKGRVEDGAAPEEIPYNSFAWRRKFSKSRRDAADAWA